jgi:hypothetical protein
LNLGGKMKYGKIWGKMGFEFSKRKVFEYFGGK